MELTWGFRTQATNIPPKPRATSFFPLRKLKDNQPILKKPVMHLAHLGEENASDDEDQESYDPSRIKGVTEEFKQTKSTATIVAAQNISSLIAPW